MADKDSILSDYKQRIAMWSSRAEMAKEDGRDDLYEKALNHKERSAADLAEVETLANLLLEKLQETSSEAVEQSCLVCSVAIKNLELSVQEAHLDAAYLNSPGNEFAKFISTFLCAQCSGQLNVIQAARCLFEDIA